VRSRDRERANPSAIEPNFKNFSKRRRRSGPSEIEHAARRSATSSRERAPKAIAMRRSRAELVGQDRKLRTRYVAEEQRGTAGLDDAVGDLGDLEVRIHGRVDLDELVRAFAAPTTKRSERIECHRLPEVLGAPGRALYAARSSSPVRLFERDRFEAETRRAPRAAA
jgi:hypothetical protein